MRVGGRHNWCYRPGEWEETKVAPDKWQFTFAVNKRRKWAAPEGSGAPTGTQYHWYVLAHQNVRKLDANEYTTSMTGVKYKLAHRRPGSVEWSANGRVQLRQLIRILEENLEELRKELEESSGGAPHQRLEKMGGRGLPQRSFVLSMLGQAPLEAYTTPTGERGASPSAPPSLGANSSSSSKREFFPKNNK